MRLDHLIAIDTEYHIERLETVATRSGYTYEEKGIDKVFCLCATDSTGKAQATIWLADSERGSRPELLDELAEALGISEPVFVCHAFDKAERQAVKFLGVDPVRYKWADTYHLARMLQNSFDAKKTDGDDVFNEDAIRDAIERKEAKEFGLSYASLCKRFNLALVDTDLKQRMRGFCIDDETEGHEKEIMAYCLEDTRYLIPLLVKLIDQYRGLLNRSFCPLRPLEFGLGSARDRHPERFVDDDRALAKLVEQGRYIALFGEIADKGIPLSAERVERVKENAIEYREQVKRDFNEKYQIFEEDKKGKLHEVSTRSQAYIKALIDEKQIANYPKSSTGKWSLSGDVLKEYFKGEDNFGEAYRQLNKLLRQLGAVAKEQGSPFVHFYDGCLHYGTLNAYGTTTSRCAPSTKRFIFGWHKSLYGLIEPPAGKWLVELDFGSEETFCQCAICRDAEYNEIYNSKDIYLAFAYKMNLIPHADWATLSKSELKVKYSKVRKQIKPMVLGLSYGMGARKLAAKCGMTIEQAEAYHDAIVSEKNGVLKTSSQWKTRNLRRGIAPEITRAFSLPDGYICGYTPATANQTSVGNWPFQSAGGQILRELVAALYDQGVDVRATIHDAVFFMVDAGDMGTIARVAETMRTTANRVLNVPKGWSMKVGEPDIIAHGDVWTPEHEFDAAFQRLLRFRKQGGVDAST